MQSDSGVSGQELERSQVMIVKVARGSIDQLESTDAFLLLIKQGNAQQSPGLKLQKLVHPAIDLRLLDRHIPIDSTRASRLDHLPNQTSVVRNSKVLFLHTQGRAANQLPIGLIP
jgi:hypothetical protein